MLDLNCKQSKIESCAYSDRLLNKLLSLNAKNKIDVAEVKKAICYGMEYHADQKRQSGEPYFSHPIEVAIMTADYMFDTEAIVAALLHDVIEDTNSSFCQVELIFGTKVAKIVDMITKISVNHLLSKEATFCKINTLDEFNHVNNLNKKAITIKVIDRLHNMQTIQHIKSVEKQKNIAKETIQFYIPLARYVGLHAVAQELQDIAIKTLNV